MKLSVPPSCHGYRRLFGIYQPTSLATHSWPCNNRWQISIFTGQRRNPQSKPVSSSTFTAKDSSVALICWSYQVWIDRFMGPRLINWAGAFIHARMSNMGPRLLNWASGFFHARMSNNEKYYC